MKNNKYEVLITDQPEAPLINREYVSRTKLDKMQRDIRKLLKDDAAKYYGRTWNKETGNVYSIFTLEGKRIIIEDPEATEILQSLFDSDGRLRELDIK